jgi:hypothetical protein
MRLIFFSTIRQDTFTARPAFPVECYTPLQYPYGL